MRNPWVHLGSQAAIKVLRNQLTSEDIQFFRAEARTLVRLIHPHIVRVLDFGLEGKTAFLVMDYAPNGTLRRLHPKGRPVPLATIVSYVKQLAEALQFAHDNLNRQNSSLQPLLQKGQTPSDALAFAPS